MQRINILYVITKLELGGAQKQLLALISHLEKQKFAPCLFTAKEGLLIAQALSIEGLTLKRSGFLERPLNPLKDLLSLIEIYIFIKKNNIRIVHTHSSKAGIIGRLAARLAGVETIIHTVHGWSFNDFQPALLRRAFIMLERIAAIFSDRLIVVSNHDKNKGLAYGISRDDKYSLIRYGIDYGEFSQNNSTLRKKLGINDGQPAVAMVSCLKPQKCPEDFLRLASLVREGVPDVKFILVGDGVLRPRINKMIRELKLEKNIILTGWRRDVPQVISSADVFMLTSLWEGLPIAVLEACAAARPVIATDTGGIKEVIREGENGYLNAPHDIKGMSERLSSLLGDAEKRRLLGQKAKDSLNSDFRFENMLNSTRHLYEALTGAEGSACVN